MSKVPKFGAWEANENFTVYFDTARKNKTNGQKINPNDPEENSDLFEAPLPRTRSDEQRENKRASPSHAENEPRPQARPVAAKAETKEVKPQYVPTPPQEGRAKVPQFGGWNAGEGAQYTAYFDTARKAKNTGGDGEPAMNRDVSDKARAPPVAKAPRVESKEDVSRNPSRGSASSAHGSEGLGKQPSVPKANPQSRSGGGRANKAAAVPEFGGWNKPNNEPSKEGYTIAFARAKEERNTPLNPAVPPPHHQQPQYNNKKQASCCTIL